MESIHNNQKLKAQFNSLSTRNIKKSLMGIYWVVQFIKNKFITVTMKEWDGSRNLKSTYFRDLFFCKQNAFQILSRQSCFS